MDSEDWKKDFSPEELAALGEAEPEKKDDEKPPEGAPAPKQPEGEVLPPAGEKPPEGEGKPQQPPAETQPTPEEQKAMEAMGARFENGFIIDEDGTRIKLERWKKVYWTSKETERQLELTKQKNELLKTKGPDEYYRLYPEEAPQGYQPKQSAPAYREVLPINDNRILDMTVKGGTYDGMALRDVMKEDPDTAAKMYGGYIAQIQEHNRKIHDAEKKTNDEIKSSVESFGAARAKELFGLDDVSKITPEQKQKIETVGRSVLDWQVLNNCLHYSFEHAYQIMTMEDRLKSAREEGARNALKGLNTQAPPSIGGPSKGAPADTGWDAVGKMTRDELARHIDKLPEKEYSKFLKDAPASIKAKFPGIWD